MYPYDLVAISPRFELGPFPNDVWFRAQNQPKPSVKEPVYKVGDLVSRKIDNTRDDSKTMYGIITAIYCGVSIYGDGPVCFYDELYEVDFGQYGIKGGYFDIGLTRVSSSGK